MPALTLSDRLQHRHSRTSRGGRRDGVLAMNDRFSPPAEALAAAGARTATEQTFDTHDKVPLFYRHWPSHDGKAARGDRDLSPRPRALRPHGAPARRARPARFRFLRLGCARARAFARPARPCAELRHVGARRADVHRAHRNTPRLRSGGDRGHRPERRRGRGRDLGARLRAARAGPRPRIAGVRGQALRAVRAPGLAAHAGAARKFLRHELRQGEAPDPRPARIASYESDPLLARAISVDILLGLYDASQRVVADAAAITLPTQLLISGSDWVVRHAPQHAFFDRLGATRKEKHVLPGFFHDTLGEKDRAEPLRQVRRFVLDLFAAAPERPDLRAAHRQGFTKDEADALARPLPRAFRARPLLECHARGAALRRPRCPRAFASAARPVSTPARTLDYVYRNEARGRTPIGRLIDRIYLESIGWRGIRQRKRHVEELLRDAMRRVRARGATGAHRRHRGRPRPLRVSTRSPPASNVPHRSCCATIPSATCATARR